MPFNEDDYLRLEKDIIESGEIRDAIKCYQDEDGNFCILGGFNRWKIATENNIKTIPVQIFEGSTQEYKDLVIQDNLNRRHLTSKQKRELIGFLLKNDPEQSNKSIAKKTSSSKTTVQKARQKLQSCGHIDHVENVKGQDGKSYKKPTTPKKQDKPKKLILK